MLLIGRDAELALLAQALDDVRARPQPHHRDRRRGGDRQERAARRARRPGGADAGADAAVPPSTSARCRSRSPSMPSTHRRPSSPRDRLEALGAVLPACCRRGPATRLPAGPAERLRTHRALASLLDAARARAARRAAARRPALGRRSVAGAARAPRPPPAGCAAAARARRASGHDPPGGRAADARAARPRQPSLGTARCRARIARRSRTPRDGNPLFLRELRAGAASGLPLDVVGGRAARDRRARRRRGRAAGRARRSRATRSTPSSRPPRPALRADAAALDALVRARSRSAPAPAARSRSGIRSCAGRLRRAAAGLAARGARARRRRAGGARRRRPAPRPPRRALRAPGDAAAVAVLRDAGRARRARPRRRPPRAGTTPRCGCSATIRRARRSAGADGLRARGRGTLRRARDALLEAHAAAPSLQLAIACARVETELGRYADARRRLLAADGRPRPRFELAVVAYHEGRLAELGAWARRALAAPAVTRSCTRARSRSARWPRSGPTEPDRAQRASGPCGDGSTRVPDEALARGPRRRAYVATAQLLCARFAAVERRRRVLAASARHRATASSPCRCG